MRVKRENFNRAWRFCAGDAVAAEQREYDDSRWQAADLPHDWSIAQNFDRELIYGSQHAYLPNNVVWYRKQFDYAPGAEDERILLEFDGAYRSPDLFVNGRHLLKRFNGYLGFEADITAALTPGENVIVLRVDNSIEKSSRWYTGSGINRNVWLHRVKGTHFLRNSLRIVAEADGTLKLSAESSRPGEIRFQVFDPSGRPCDSTTKIADPLLWSPEQPNLYRCRAQLYDATGKAVDELEERFGFRSIEFSPAQGLIFNGKKLLLRGVNLHEDLCGMGTAIFRDGVRRRYEKLKEFGVNAIRLAHHPYAPEWYELADEMGFLVFAEAFDKWTGQYNGFQVDFETTWRQDLAEFVTGRRNHPCIFLWSVGNEVVDQQLDGNSRYGIRQYRKMRDEVRRLDPTRRVTCALYPARQGGVLWDDPRFLETAIAPLAFEMDVVSVNYMGQFFRPDHKKHPGMIFLVSEENTSDYAERWLLFDHDIGCGSFFWGGYDYLGEAQWPHKNWFRGLMDRAGFRKPLSYRLEALWSDRPVARIAIAPDREIDSVEWNSVKLDWETLVSHWNWESGAECRLCLFSNCDSVTLSLNGRTVLTHTFATAEKCCLKSVIPYEPGELKLTGYDAQGKILTEHTLRTAGQPAAVRTAASSGEELVHVELTLVDQAGTVCPEERRIHLEVEGGGTLAGVTNSDTRSPQRFSADAVVTSGGRALAVIRRNGTGEIRLRAEAETDGEPICAEITVPPVRG